MGGRSLSRPRRFGRAFALALGVVAACGRPSPAFRYYPEIPPPKDLSVVDLTTLDPGEAATFSTLQGLVARRTPSIWLTPSPAEVGVDYSDAWLAELARYGIPSSPADPWGLVVDHRSEIAGYVLFDPGTASENVATSLAGLLGGIAMPAASETKAQAAGLTSLGDARGMTERDAFSGHTGSWYPDALFQILPTRHTVARDLATYLAAFTFFDPAYADDYQAYLGLLAPDRPVLGWGDPTSFEHTWVLPASRHSAFTTSCVAGDAPLNLTALSGVPAQPRQKAYRTGTDRAGVHTVTFVMSDGDNIAMDVAWIPFAPTLWESPSRGSLPLGWTTSPMLVDLAPVVLDYLYRTASTTRDCFVAGVSGDGYFYPDQYLDLSEHAQHLGGYLARSDLRLVMLMTYVPDGFIAATVAPYAALPEVDGGLAINYAAGYDLLDGRIVWSQGKPFIGARYALCKYCSISSMTPDQLVQALNQQPRDPARAEGYSFVIVQNFSYGVDDVAQVVSRLDPAIEVIAPDEFVGRVTRNVTH